MGNTYSVLLALGLALSLSGCGKGIDATLETASEQAYRASLDAAWKDMSAEQQNAFNWAVSNFTLEQLIAKYPKMTPRSVVVSEADAYIKLKTEAAAATALELANNAERLAKEEQIVREAQAELAKITATGIALQRASFGFGESFVFVSKNESAYDVSSAKWDAWLFIDDEQKSDRHCSVRAYYKTSGGLPRGKTLKSEFKVGFMDCRNWDTLEVRNAKTRRFRLDLDPASVENFAEKKILPHFSPTRADYEGAIKAAKDEIEVALKAKATLK